MDKFQRFIESTEPLASIEDHLRVTFLIASMLVVILLGTKTPKMTGTPPDLCKIQRMPSAEPHGRLVEEARRDFGKTPRPQLSTRRLSTTYAPDLIQLVLEIDALEVPLLLSIPSFLRSCPRSINVTLSIVFWFHTKVAEGSCFSPGSQLLLTYGMSEEI